MKRREKFRTIRNYMKILWLGMLLILIIEVITFVVCSSYQNNQMDKTGLTIADSMEQGVVTQLNMIHEVAKKFSLNASISNYIFSKDIGLRYQSQKEMDRLILFTMDTNPMITAIGAQNLEAMRFYNLSQKIDNSLAKVLTSMNSESIVDSPSGVVTILDEDDGTQRMYYLYPLFKINYEGSYQKGTKGILIFEINMDVFLKGIGSKKFYYDSSFRITTEKIKENSDSNINSKKFSTIERYISDYGIFLEIKLSRALILQQNSMYFILIIISAVIVIIISLLSYLTLHLGIAKPVNQLIMEIKELQFCGRQRRLVLKSEGEIGLISKQINKMLEKNEQQMHEIISTQARLYELELSQQKVKSYALQMQISPHFLFNSLQCIRSLGLIAGIPEISSAATAISRIFRYSIQSSTFVTIKDEVIMLAEYLKLCQMRLEYDYSLDIPLELEDKEIIRMILQPIVENAIEHGVQERYDDKVRGKVTVEGSLTEKYLYFVVKDNGPGISDVKLREINELLSLPSTSIAPQNHVKSIGIVNVNTRIRCTYGEEYGIKIKCSDTMGTEVVVKIPNNDYSLE